MTDAKKTVLFDRHAALAAKSQIVPFAGWEMALWYQSISAEHGAVRKQAGLFDCTHMAVLEITGKDALNFLNILTTNDVSMLKPGKAQYSYILNLFGNIIDDVIIYCISGDNYMMVVNAANEDSVKNWIQKVRTDFGELSRAEKSEPLGNTLKELTEQVSAIRDYASSQQDQMRKLQDGYDWGIIRTFCLRVIRCIDNIESRIEELSAARKPAGHLEEVRDELLFALESSGVEQFEPEFGSEYRSQEKYAEAVKEKEASGRPDQAGTIAKVLRPGYRYVMDEENFKVVRTAQVMLFGCKDE